MKSKRYGNKSWSSVKKGPQAKKFRQLLEVEKDKATYFLLKTPEEPQPRRHTDFRLWTSRPVKEQIWIALCH